LKYRAKKIDERVHVRALSLRTIEYRSLSRGSYGEETRFDRQRSASIRMNSTLPIEGNAIRQESEAGAFPGSRGYSRESRPRAFPRKRGQLFRD